MRSERLDALRGVAIVWMAVFHFCFDLDHFGFIAEDFRRDPFWTGQRTAIVSLFLFCAGLGQALAAQAEARGGHGWPRFWRRWAQVAGCAVLVSVGSWLMFPRSWIFFGVLHGVALMLVLLRLVRGGGTWLWPAGALALLLPWLWTHPAFDPPWLAWTGFAQRKPVTEDFVPLFPWFGVMLWGFATGRALLARWPALLAGALPRAGQPLAVLGRWSLSFYMLHQPVLIGMLMAVAALRGP
jgi:uncharacterized membrane protein